MLHRPDRAAHRAPARTGGGVKGGRSAPRRPPVASFVSLGCAKNTVDSERLLAALVQDGFLIAEDPREADVCLVNTCGFIADAREETASVLAGLAASRDRSGRPVVVALGCLVERAREHGPSAAFLAGADARAGFGEYMRLPALCRALLDPPAGGARATTPGGRLDAAFHRLPRLLTGAPHTAPVKVSEGCSNACRFCTIPAIRGPQVSRPVEDIVTEANQLVAAGARELCLIGQDTTSYGRDLYGARRLPDLLRALSGGVAGDAWFRLMYAYPRFLDDAVLGALASDPRFCPYIDLPLQHVSDRMLRAMGRGMSRDRTLRLLDRIEARLPGVALRGAFIVGHPGESEADFEGLCRFIDEGRFLYAGVFAYSPEAGTPSARMPGRVPARVKAQRYDELMRRQQAATRRRLEERLGETDTVLVDGPAAGHDAAPEGARRIARTRHQAPEIDGVTFLGGRGAGRLRPGDFTRARVTGRLDYDLVAEPA